MNKINDYIILTSEDQYSLMKQVGERIKDGWQPFGSLQVVATKSETKNDNETWYYNEYCQAMVKYN